MNNIIVWVHNSCLYAVGSVPGSLLRVDGCFWIIQDSNRHLCDVYLHVWSIHVPFHSMPCPVLLTCSAVADEVMLMSYTARLCSLSLCPKVLLVRPM